MAYRVRVSRRARRDLSYLFAQINAQHSDAAFKWYKGLKQSLMSLQEFPNRCPVAKDLDKARNLLYGEKPNVYRVVFRVLEEQNLVEVLHIHHGARGNLTASDLI